MDDRVGKFWDDAQTLVPDARNTEFKLSVYNKILKELRTISRLLQRNQSTRFSENAMQKMTECIGFYISYAKRLQSDIETEKEMIHNLLEACLSVAKDALAMPHNVVGTKQKARLLKWHNELEAVLNPTELLIQPKTYNVLDIDEEGYLTLLDEETGDINENTICVLKSSDDYNSIKNNFDTIGVKIVAIGDQVEQVILEGSAITDNE